MSDSNNKKSGAAKAPVSTDAKKIVLIVSVIVFFLLLALIPGIIAIVNGNNDSPDTGEKVLGTYEFNLGLAGSDIYTFTEGNKVTVKTSYFEGTDPGATDLTVSEKEYTYVIAIESGKKVLKLTDVESGEVETHLFERGNYTVNGYICSNEACVEEDPKPKSEDNMLCNFCSTGELAATEKKVEFLYIDEEMYKKK